MAAKKTSISKSEFIRLQPSTLSAAEVVTKGKAAGLTILPGLVYEVRRMAKAKKGTARAIVPPKTVAAAAKAPAVSKADFVRARAHLSPREIVEDAKAAGINFEVQYVYNVRRHDAATGRQPEGRTPPVRRSAAVRRPIATASKAEDLLKAVAAELGLGRAIEILQGERARVRAVIGG
jgi:hypothetical protein